MVFAKVEKVSQKGSLSKEKIKIIRVYDTQIQPTNASVKNKASIRNI